MSAAIVLPEWKRLDAKFMAYNKLNVLTGGGGSAYEEYIRFFGNVLSDKHVIGNVDGYLGEPHIKTTPYFSIKQIDVHNGGNPSDLLFGLMQIDTGGRGKFHAMDESFFRMDRAHAKGFYLDITQSMNNPLWQIVKVSKEQGLLVHHDLIVLAPGTRLVLLRVVDGAQNAVVADNTEIYAREGSHIDYVTLNRCPESSFYTAIKRARVDGNAKVNWYTIDLGGSNAAVSTRSLLAGPGAESRLTGVVVARGGSRKDMSYETFHTAPDTVTSVLVRAAITDTAKVVYRALTHIASGAKRAKVEQSERSIMLGEHARFDGIPSLWIDEDDVIASHSASSGVVDEQELFYLKSRGIPHAQAERLITDGFIASLLSKEPVSMLKGVY